MKKITALLLIALMLLGGCAAPAEDTFSPDDSPLITVDPEVETPEETAPESEQTAETPEGQPDETPEDPEKEPDGTAETPVGQSVQMPETPEQNVQGESEQEQKEENTDWTTSCMSFNILERNTGAHTYYAHPEVRAPWIVETIKKYKPDLLGCQEVTNGTNGEEFYDMYTYLTNALTNEGYAFSGMMDSKGKAGSNMTATRYSIGAGLVIFWKKDRFEMKDFGAQIYSNSSVRHFQWVKLYDKQEDITILMTNTHLAADNPPRVSTDADFDQQANELLRFWEKNCKKDMALYATGDYNRQPNTTAYANLLQGRYLNSADFALEADATAWIDHVFINGDVQECIKYHRCTETFEPKGVAPSSDPNNRNKEYCASDHYAVISYCTNL